MAKVNLVNKQVKMSLEEIIRFQFLTHCTFNSISMSELDFDCLTALTLWGPTELNKFCNAMAEIRVKKKLQESHEKSPLKVQASPQTIRNILIRLEKEKLILKEGAGRKSIKLNPVLNIQSLGNILLNLKVVHIESQEN